MMLVSEQSLPFFRASESFRGEGVVLAYNIFSYEEAALQVLMYVCLSLCGQVEILACMKFVY